MLPYLKAMTSGYVAIIMPKAIEVIPQRRYPITLFGLCPMSLFRFLCSMFRCLLSLSSTPSVAFGTWEQVIEIQRGMLTREVRVNPLF
jgi:hypothetical protein